METLTKWGFARCFSIWGGGEKSGKKLKWGFGVGEGCDFRGVRRLFFEGGVEWPFFGQCVN